MVQHNEEPNSANVKENLIHHAERDSKEIPVVKDTDDDEGNVDLPTSSFKNAEGAKQEETKPVEKAKVPDGGYGWFVVLGCFLSHVIIGGFERNDGVYYLQFRARFGQSAQLTSWPGALVSTIRLFLGPVASALCNLYSVRTTTMFGALILTLAQILNAFTPNFYFLFFSHAALQGLGRGLMYAPSLIILNMYFDKHQGLAAGLGTSGVGVGTFCLVPLTQLFFDYYGFEGAFLLMAGVALHGTVVALLYRPLSMHYRFTQKTSVKYIDEGVVDNEVVLAQLADAADATSIQSLHLHHKNSCCSEQEEAQALTSVIPSQPERSKIKKDGWFMSSLKICFPKEHKEGAGKSKKKLFHFGLLKDPAFLMFCVSIGLFTAAFKSAFTFIPALVKSKNIPESDAALVLSISGVFDTLARILSGFVLDRPLFRPFRPIVYNSFIFAIATVSFILPSLTNFTSMAIMCSFYGTLTGAFISQKSVVLVDILGIEHMASSFGILICFQAIGTCIGPPMSGALRDAFGGFTEAFYLGGCFMVVAGLLMIASNIFLKVKQRKNKQISVLLVDIHRK